MDDKTITILNLLMTHDFLSAPQIREALGDETLNVKSIRHRIEWLDKFIQTLNPRCRILNAKNKGYYMTQDYFDDSQKNYLKDIINASPFIGNSAKEELVSLLYVFLKKDIQTPVMGQTYFRKISTITKAIEENKRIRFRYESYKVNENKVMRTPHLHGNVKGNKEIYEVSPYLIRFNKGKYYLVGGFGDFQKKIYETRVYRIDRMEQVQTYSFHRSYYHHETEESILAKADTMINNYIAKDDKLYTVRMYVDESILNACIEDFGDRIQFEVRDKIIATIKDVPITDGLMNNIMKLSNKITVIEPQIVIDELQRRVLDLYEKYKVR